ncbi:MAG: hypothetical protein LCH46_05770 [Proteobacteria bacterium]|nr:hypothetical protein [Pseudomonadota bacterium]
MAGLSWQPVIVALGSDPKSEVAAAQGLKHGWMATLGGIPVLARVHAMLHDPAHDRTILLATDDEASVARVLARDMRFVRIVPAAGTTAASALAAGQISGRYPIIIVKAEAALLSPRLIRAFQLASLKSGADATAAFVTADGMRKAFPDMRHNTTRLGEDNIKFCGMIAIMSPNGLKLLDTWTNIEREKRSKAGIARAIGFGTYLRYLFGKLSLDQAFGELSKLAGMTARPILLARPEAGLDLSRKADFAVAENLVRLPHQR